MGISGDRIGMGIRMGMELELDLDRCVLYAKLHGLWRGSDEDG